MFFVSEDLWNQDGEDYFFEFDEFGGVIRIFLYFCRRVVRFYVLRGAECVLDELEGGVVIVVIVDDFCNIVIYFIIFEFL